MIKVKCEKCERIISKNNYKKHFKSCDGIFSPYLSEYLEEAFDDSERCYKKIYELLEKHKLILSIL